MAIDISMPINRKECAGLNTIYAYYQVTLPTTTNGVTVATAKGSALNANANAVLVQLNAATHEVHFNIDGNATTNSPKVNNAVPIMLSTNQAAVAKFYATDASQILTVLEVKV